MKIGSNALLISASGLLFSAAALALYLQGSHCKRLGNVKTQQLIGYVRERYGIPASTGLSVTEDHLLNDSCTREIAVSSPAWRTPRSFFLSPDQNYLSTMTSDLRVKPQPLAQASSGSALPFSPLASVPAPTMGDNGAQATLVEFSDFECPFCSRFAHVLNTDLSSTDRSKMKVEFHFFPLPFHPWAERAAEEAFCVSQQSQPIFWQLHDDLFVHQKELTGANLDSHVDAFLKNKKIDSTAFHACAASDAARAAVASDVALGKKYGVSGTPTSFLNGQRIVGARSAGDLQKTLDASIAHPVAMVAPAQPNS